MTVMRVFRTKAVMQMECLWIQETGQESLRSDRVLTVSTCCMSPPSWGASTDDKCVFGVM